MKVKAIKTFVCGRYYVPSGETADISADCAGKALRLGLAEYVKEQEKEPAKEPVKESVKRQTRTKK